MRGQEREETAAASRARARVPQLAPRVPNRDGPALEAAGDEASRGGPRRASRVRGLGPGEAAEARWRREGGVDVAEPDIGGGGAEDAEAGTGGGAGRRAGCEEGEVVSEC